MAPSASLRCPRCLSLNPVGAPVCHSCGAPLDAARAVPATGRGPSTLLLTALWLGFGPGVLVPLFFLAPGFFDVHTRPGLGWARVLGSLFYFFAAVTILGKATSRYFR